MTTDQAPAKALATPKEEQPSRPKVKPTEPDAQVKSPPGNSPKESPQPDGVQQNDQAPENGQSATAAEDVAAKRPAGTELMATVLTGTSEHVASEHALATANIALQINLAAQTGASRKTNIGTDTLNRVRKTFVAPHRFLDAWEILADRHLLLLEGTPGNGRQHLATFLLDAFCDARVRLLRSGTLADLTEADLTSGGGHLWRDPVGEFDLRAAETLAGRLRSVGGYLVAIGSDGRKFAPELSDYVAEPGRPDLDEVMRNHCAIAAVALIDDQAVVEVRRRLSGAQQAARLASLLGQVASNRKSLETALAEADDPEGETASWFGDLPQREDRAFALALAALDGLSLPSVVAGARLADELIQRSEDREGRYVLKPFQRPIKALLTAVEAERESGTRETGYGEVPIISIRLRRSGRAREILDAVWESFPYLQEIYLEWMNTLARSPDPYVRERVALVAGLIATHDFEFVRSRLVNGWALAEDDRLRRAAATALRPPALNDELREIVWRLLDDWAIADDDGSDLRHLLRRTAATALGAPVGGTDPGRALDLITLRLLSHNTNDYDYEIWTATALAVSELFGDGGSPTSDAVLGRAAEWAETKETGPVNVAVTVLLGLAGKSPDRAPEDGRRLPPLVRAAGRSRENVEHTGVLWRLALDHRQLAPAALRGLRKLTKHVGEEADGSAELRTLVAGIPRTDRERRTLRYATRRWAEEEPHSPVFKSLSETLCREE